MVFHGTILELNQASTAFHIHHINVHLRIDTGRGGTPLLMFSTPHSNEILAVVQHLSILMHPETLTFLWSNTSNGETLEQSSQNCYCFRFHSKVEFDIFNRTKQAFQRLHQGNLMYQSILMELKLQKIDDINRLIISGSQQIISPVSSQAPAPRFSPPLVRESSSTHCSSTASSTTQVWKMNSNAHDQALARQRNHTFLMR